MKKKVCEEKGLLSLEASISLTIFIFLMLFLYSFFVVFETRNEMGHVVLSTANSMALDAYENTILGDTDKVQGLLYELYGQVANPNGGFTDYRDWYDSATETDENGNTVLSDTFLEAIKSRFISYLANGDNNLAKEKLKKYHVKDDIDGLDFSGSHVTDGRLFLKVRYALEYEYNAFGLGEISFEQSACSKLWIQK